MRVIWAGVLVLLPLLAEYATAQRCRGQPDAPEFSTIRCFRKRNTCRATCQSGYIFTQKDSKLAAYKCQGGEWVMERGEETRCDPYCDPDCENGDCVEPDVCECDEGFTGDLCDEEEEEYLEPEADPEAYKEEDYYSEEDYGPYDYDSEEEEYEDHEEAHAVDESAKTTDGPEVNTTDRPKANFQSNRYYGRYPGMVISKDFAISNSSHNNYLQANGTVTGESRILTVKGGLIGGMIVLSIFAAGTHHFLRRQ